MTSLIDNGAAGPKSSARDPDQHMLFAAITPPSGRFHCVRSIAILSRNAPTVSTTELPAGHLCVMSASMRGYNERARFATPRPLPAVHFTNVRKDLGHEAYNGSAGGTVQMGGASLWHPSRRRHGFGDRSSSQGSSLQRRRLAQQISRALPLAGCRRRMLQQRHVLWNIWQTHRDGPSADIEADMSSLPCHILQS